MNTLGIGIDIIENKRVKKSILNKKFVYRIFSNSEINDSKKSVNKAGFFSKRFAAKEALTKALGTGIGRGVNIKNIEVVNDRLGKPCIKLKGNVDKFLKKCIKKNKYNIFLSLSDDEPWAQATVIISYN